MKNETESTTWNFEEQGALEGTFKEMQEDVGPNKSKVYRVDLVNGESADFWGGTVLDRKMSKVIEEYGPGTKVKIEYLGKEKGKRGEYKNYSVQAWVEE